MKDYSKAGLSIGGAGATQKNITISPVIVSKLKKGDHQAFEFVFHTFYGRVKSFIKVITRTEDLAEELTQQVFVDLWIYRERLDPGKNMSSYIYTMARNNAITALRQQLKFELNDFDYNQMKESRLTDDELIAKETTLLVDLTVAAMPPKRKQVYLLSRNEGKSNNEIAEQLHISKKVVEKHLRLAIHDLKKVVELIILFFYWNN